jgi:glyoxylase-like metal-dependent hydrolase (beta-lactamase superfamily II)
MNTYVVIDPEANACAVIDPGADAEAILALAGDAKVEKILLTHGHGDHVGALETVKQATGAPVYLHPLDHERFGVAYDIPLEDGMVVEVGNLRLRAVHTPGHTPGMISLIIDHRVVVGDTLFVGGPGRTSTPEDFAVTMRTMQEIVFAWPDETEFYPGHGPSGVIGQERPAFNAFVARGWPADLSGDVAWAQS